MLNRKANSPLAIISAPTPSLTTQPSVISPQRFYHHVLDVAKLLPDHPFGINLCENRYLFCVAFCAVLIRQQTNLLPPNRAPQTLATLELKHECYYLVDGFIPETHSPTINLATMVLTDSDTPLPIAYISAKHLAAICFTSGSTGDSKPIYKTWGLFYRASQINGQEMTEGCPDPIYQLATVPPQHMWGLETSVLLPLLNQRIVLSDAKPLYPADIISLLTTLPGPRLLVSTPIHLRALMAYGATFPTLARILCATSPLAQHLAVEIEHKIGGTLLEVYGCSEMGSMAIRRTSTTDTWTLFPGFQLSQSQQGLVTACAKHVEQETVLGDYLQVIDDKHFRLSGRTEDLINIGGKRGSLAEINKILLQFEGIDDGVVFQPDDSKVLSRLAALVVLQPNVTKDELLKHFRDRIDPAFIPRPVLAVPRLPRSDTGKLPRKAILSFYNAKLRQD